MKTWGKQYHNNQKAISKNLLVIVETMAINQAVTCIRNNLKVF